jgi:hypothetical protein
VYSACCVPGTLTKLSCIAVPRLTCMSCVSSVHSACYVPGTLTNALPCCADDAAFRMKSSGAQTMARLVCMECARGGMSFA